MKLPIKAERLCIAEFDESMAKSVHLNSLDDDNRRFIPDEVFETVENARNIIDKIRGFYLQKGAPLIYAVVLNDGTHIGHVQAYPEKTGWEIGYHIAKKYTGQGFAAESLKAFLNPVMERLNILKIYGVCSAGNIASIRVLEKNGFILEYDGEGCLHGKKQKIRRYKYQL